jgi:ferredoxin-NADP reductase
MFYQTSLIDRREIARHTMAFYFERPTDFQFTPGQYVDIDVANETRSMTIASTPREDHLMIATRMTGSGLKTFLNTCTFRTQVSLTGPLGSFGSRLIAGVPVVCIAGGIGVTPVRSLVRSRTLQAHTNHSVRILLSTPFYEDAPFVTELAQEASVTVHESRISGRFDATQLHSAIGSDPAYYQYIVAGTNSFTAALWSVLHELQVPSEHIHLDRFAGYS